MLLWFLGTAAIAMWVVFRDPAIDHRVVLLGAVLPVLVEGALGRPLVLHTLAGSVLLMSVVMAATVGRRAARRRWLGLPIGTFFSLVAGAVWTNRSLFWWPIDGWGFPDGPIPAWDRPLVVIVVLELLGAAALWWAYRRVGLDDASRRARFVRTGRLDPAIVHREPPSC